ncbi:MAG: acyl-CoA desaturase [Candidatus Pacebacteria bacterium]|nr:acyl-CoA desaturase [Candidatus Paceibacterota bacterium]
MKKNIRFPRDATTFSRELRKKVNTYFKERNLAKTGNKELFVKAGFFLSIFFGVVALIYLSNPHFLILYGAYLFLGFAMAGIGMNVMHDANHGSFSSQKWVNRIMGASIYILAGNVYNWIVQHNQLHHTFTNIEGHDEDIEAGRFIRFSKHADYLWYHRFQHWYAPVLYSLLTLNWVITTDFTQTGRFLKDNRINSHMPKPFWAWTIVIVSKLVLIAFWFVLPVLLGLPLIHVVFGFICMHLVAGSILSHIFQLAHVNQDAQVLTEEEVSDPLLVHQLETTANFGTQSRFLKWYTGGLTHQVEHHLFPNISHVHYPKIAHIVSSLARRFNIPYYETVSFWKAVKEHYAHIKFLSRKPVLS